MERDSRAGAREAAGMNPSSVHEREKLGLENGESGQIICWHFKLVKLQLLEYLQDSYNYGHIDRTT